MSVFFPEWSPPPPTKKKKKKGSLSCTHLSHATLPFRLIPSITRGRRSLPKSAIRTRNLKNPGPAVPWPLGHAIMDCDFVFGATSAAIPKRLHEMTKTDGWQLFNKRSCCPLPARAHQCAIRTPSGCTGHGSRAHTGRATEAAAEPSRPRRSPSRKHHTGSDTVRSAPSVNASDPVLGFWSQPEETL